MVIIEIKGEANPQLINEDGNEVDEQDAMKLADGITIPDDFTAYSQDLKFHRFLIKGYTKFKYEPAKKELFAVCRYESLRELTSTEISQLVDYTQGQWSDGIGEGFEQEPCAHDDNGNELYISPWTMGQTITVKQYNA